jgi:hypothetical protein
MSSVRLVNPLIPQKSTLEFAFPENPSIKLDNKTDRALKKPLIKN